MNSLKRIISLQFLFKILIVSMLVNCVCGTNFACTQNFSQVLNCEEKITNFDRQLINNVIGNPPILLKNKLEWTSKANSRYFKCEKEAVNMCLSLSIDTDNIYMVSQECRERITQQDNKNISQLQQALFSKQIKSEQEFIDRVNSLEGPQSNYFSCLVNNISFQLKSKQNLRAHHQ